LPDIGLEDELDPVRGSFPGEFPRKRSGSAGEHGCAIVAVLLGDPGFPTYESIADAHIALNAIVPLPGASIDPPGSDRLSRRLSGKAMHHRQ
jgi:hypothetical protein